MTCSKHLGRLLQASCLGLIGALTIVGCGGSDTVQKPDGGSEVGSGGTGGTVLAKVTVLPSSLAFGEVVVGGVSSSASAVTVTNIGTAPMTLAPSVTGPFVISSNNCAAVAPNAPCAISVVFQPTAGGPASGVLVVTPTTTVTLTGTGISPSDISVNDKIDLGQILVGVPVSNQVTVTASSAVSGLVCTTSGVEIAADTTKPCPATLKAGESCNYGFTFTAASAGTKSASVVCNAAGLAKPLSTQINAVAVTPPALDFQAPKTVALTGQVGVASSVISFNLVNSGGSASGSLVVTPAGDTGDYIVDNQCIVVPATAFCKINVTFKPTAVGARYLTLTVTDPTNPKLSLVATVNGTGINGPMLAVTGASTDFGSVVAGGASTALTFTVTNAGGVDSGAVTVASSDAQFAITTNGCNGAPLAAGKTCTFAVTFKPTVAGAASANLTASATGVTGGQLPVKGVGTGAAALSLAPSSLDFGGLIVGKTSPTQTFKVTNSGQNAAGALEVVKNDSTSSVGGGSQFTYTTTCGAAGLAPSASCDVVVTFAPLKTGSASATIVVRTIDRAVSSQAGTLLGLALDASALTLACDSFGDTGTVVTKTSNPVNCTVTGASATPTGALTIAVTGDFAVGTTNTCASANLANNTSCNFALTFSPTAKGKRIGVVTVTSAAGGQANKQVTATGLGIVEIVEKDSSDNTVDPQPYDFGQETVGLTTGDTVQLTLSVYIRANVGNVNVTTAFGTPAAFEIPAGGSNNTCAQYASTAPAPTPGSPVTCVIYINFKPTARVVQTGTVTVTGASGATDSATMKGTGAGPLVISPSPAQFGNQAVGIPGSVITLTMTNNAPVGAANALDAMSYTLTGAGASQFAVVSDALTGQNIAADGGTALLGIRFIPTSAAAATATLTVTGTRHDNAGTETATVTLSGNGATAPGITATISATSFADTFASAYGTPLTVTVANAAGALPTGTISFAFSGTNASEFTTTPPSTTPATLQGSCPSTSQLVGGGSCTELVWFNPDRTIANGTTRTATLTVTDAGTGKTATLALTGKVKPQLVISPATAATAPTNIGTAIVNVAPAPSVTFTVTNNGASDIAAGGLTFTIANTANGSVNGPSLTSLFVVDNSASNTCNDIVAKNGGTCTFTVSAVATQSTLLGQFYSQLQVAVAAASTTQKVTADITATVVNPPILGLASATDLQTTAASGSTSAIRDIGKIEINTPSAPIKYTIQNTGGGNSGAITAKIYQVGTTSVLNKLSQFTVDAPACTALGETGLAPGAKCDVLVTANPTTNGVTDLGQTITADLVVTGANANLVYADNSDVHSAGGNISIRRTISATATSAVNAPYLVDDATGFAPADFGAVSSATALTLTKVIALHNPSQSAIVLAAATPPATISDNDTVDTDSVEIAGGDTNACTTGLSLAAGAKCLLKVTWTVAADAAPGLRFFTVTVDPATGGIPNANITIFGLVGTSSNLKASRASANTAGKILDFGSVMLAGTSQQETVIITNTGELPTAVPPALNISAAGTIHTSGCTTANLAPLQSCTLTIWVTPLAVGAATGNVAITGGDTIYLSWTGVVAAAINTTSGPLSFANTAVSVASASQTITVSNLADAKKSGPLTVAIVDGAGNAATDFTVQSSSTCLSTSGLAASGPCTVIVKFTPKTLTPAVKTASVTVTAGDLGGSIQPVTLTGTAIAPLTVAQNVGSGTFNTVSDGVYSLAQPVAVSSGDLSDAITLRYTNATGANKTGPLSVALTGTGASQFLITDDGCTGVPVAAAGHCDVTFVFAPKTSGAKTATLTVSGTPGDSAVVTLTGTATQ